MGVLPKTVFHSHGSWIIEGVLPMEGGVMGVDMTICLFLPGGTYKRLCNLLSTQNQKFLGFCMDENAGQKWNQA